MGQRYCKTEDQKRWPGFSRNHDFSEERGLESKAKVFELGDALSKHLYLKRIADGSLGAEPPAAAWRFFEKNGYFNAVNSQFARF